MKLKISIVVIILLSISFAYQNFIRTGSSFIGSTSSPYKNLKWPLIFGEAGTYALPDPDAARVLASYDLRLHINPPKYSATNGTFSFSDAFFNNKAKYIDPEIGSIIWTAVHPNTENGDPTNPVVLKKILDKVEAHLIATRNDPYLVGYWILDDWPRKNIKELLKKVRQKVVESNAKNLYNRPTICGFGAHMDLKSAAAANYKPNDEHVNGLTSYSPEGCDISTLYTYAAIDSVKYPNKSAADFDWSMKLLLNYTLSYMKSQGWNPETHPIIGMPQTFGLRLPAGAPSPTSGYYTPRTQDIIEQTKSFCNAGAISIIMYAWDTHAFGEVDGPYINVNTRNGILGGINECRKIWSASVNLAELKKFKNQIYQNALNRLIIPSLLFTAN